MRDPKPKAILVTQPPGTIELISEVLANLWALRRHDQADAFLRRVAPVHDDWSAVEAVAREYLSFS